MMTEGTKYSEAHVEDVIDERYVLLREIARGGMGIVFEARHQTLSTLVAMKTLTATTLAWPGVHARLMREAKASALCRHPGIVSALEAGTCAQHGPYAVFPMVEGRSLESFILTGRRFDATAIVDMAEQLCGALEVIHRHGIVHRDIKPPNVLVARSETRAGDVLRLIDFGIASAPGPRDGDVRDGDDMKLTSAGQMLGTPEYMSPEQLLEGRPGTVATDIYALSMLLYECIVGELPFTGTPVEIITGVITRGIPGIRERRADIPATLERAILRGLERDPAARYPSAAALALACRAAIGPTTIGLDLLDGPGRAQARGVAQRAFVRASYVAPIRIVGRLGTIDARTEDISEGGALVVTSSDCGEGEEVSVRMPLPSSGRVVSLDAVARWTKAQRGQRAIGLLFMGLKDESRDDIRRYVAMMTSADPPRGM